MKRLLLVFVVLCLLGGGAYWGYSYYNYLHPKDPFPGKWKVSQIQYLTGEVVKDPGVNITIEKKSATRYVMTMRDGQLVFTDKFTLAKDHLVSVSPKGKVLQTVFFDRHMHRLVFHSNGVSIAFLERNTSK